MALHPEFPRFPYTVLVPEHPWSQANLVEFEERWTGGYIFENEWRSFRTRQERKLELTTAPAHLHPPRALYRRSKGHRHLRQ